RDEIALDIACGDDGFEVTFDDKAGQAYQLVSGWKPGEPIWSGIVDGAPISVQVRPVANGFSLSHRGVDVTAYVYTELEAAAAKLMHSKSKSDTGKKVLCPMPGLVVSIAVKEGQEVKAGESLAVIEAMKMQNALIAEQDGVIKKIHANPGATLP